MPLELALRLTEVMMALAFIQQSAEHLATTRRDLWIFAPRLLCAAALLLPWPAVNLAALSLLAGLSLAMLRRFEGPYNGGSDKMSLLILWCLLAARWAPEGLWQELAFAYLGVQLVLSYFISGRVKLVNPAWRSGAALGDVFAFSAYPVSERLRALAARPRLLWLASWAVMLFEIVFPLALLHSAALWLALLIAGLFHLSNALCFGLNRFFWIWLCAYPSVIWLQAQLFG